MNLRPGTDPTRSCVTLPRPSGTMTAYLGSPDAAGPWPGVVVVHDAIGLSADLADQVEWLAGAGFLAVAPDLYWRGGRLRCMFASMRALAAGRGVAFDDLAATHDWLHDRPDCSGRIGVVGFCMGGGYALALAATGNYQAANANYGAATDYTPQRFESACPIIATYGGRDRSLRSAPAQLDSALAGAGVDHEIITYPEAGHGFLNNHSPDEIPLWARFAGHLVVTDYHAPSADDARERIVAFLDTHLRPPGEP